jgi:DNA repair protein RecO (recombination protein O)
MRRIRRTEAICLRSRDHRESSKLLTFFSLEEGRLTGIAKGARRPGSKFGAALEPFSISNIIWYWHQEKSVFTISDAELVRSFSGLAAEPARFLAAEQVGEFVLRTVHRHDPSPQLYRLVATYLGALDRADAGFEALVASFLIKAASFLGFRPELRKCLACKRAPGPDRPVTFDLEQGGVYCAECREPGAGTAGVRLDPGRLLEISGLLHTAGSQIDTSSVQPDVLDLVLRYVASHIDPLLLNSFNWRKL